MQRLFGRGGRLGFHYHFGFDASVGHILPGTDGVRRSISSRPRHILVESAPRYLPGQKVLLVGTQLLRTQLLRRTAEVPGKLYDTQDLGLDAPR